MASFQYHLPWEAQGPEACGLGWESTRNATGEEADRHQGLAEATALEACGAAEVAQIHLLAARGLPTPWQRRRPATERGLLVVLPAGSSWTLSDVLQRQEDPGSLQHLP